MLSNSKTGTLIRFMLIILLLLVTAAAHAAEGSAPAKISPGDWISLIVGVLGFVSAWAMRSNRLPSGARKWLSKLGGQEAVFDILASANSFAERTPAQRRSWAVSELQDLAYKSTGLKLPTSIANLIVEFVYQEYRKITK
jgi:hypothetical protein